jgi:hypothetical protein
VFLQCSPHAATDRSWRDASAVGRAAHLGEELVQERSGVRSVHALVGARGVARQGVHVRRVADDVVAEGGRATRVTEAGARSRAEKLPETVLKLRNCSSPAPLRLMRRSGFGRCVVRPAEVDRGDETPSAAGAVRSRRRVGCVLRTGSADGTATRAPGFVLADLAHAPATLLVKERTGGDERLSVPADLPSDSADLQPFGTIPTPE